MKKLTVLLATIIIFLVALCAASFIITDIPGRFCSTFFLSFGMMATIILISIKYPDETPEEIKHVVQDMYRYVSKIHTYRNEPYKETRRRVSEGHTIAKFKKGQKIPFAVCREIVTEAQRIESEKEVLNKRWANSFPGN